MAGALLVLSRQKGPGSVTGPSPDLETQLVAVIENETLWPEAPVTQADWLHRRPIGVQNDWIGNGNLADEISYGSSRATKLRTVEQLLSEPSMPYIVRGLVPSRGLTAVFGPPGSGKSFLVMDLVFAIAAGREQWFGRRVVQKPIAYVALEGQGGIKSRVLAWQAQAGSLAPKSVRFRTTDLSLLNPDDVEELGSEILAELGDGALTVIDTLSRASAGGDENSSTDMTTVIRNAELLGAIVNGPVILVHHTGKNADKGMRGHSSLLGAVDAAVELVHLGGARSWKLAKAKDDEAGGEHPFELSLHCVDNDQWGDEVWSCAVRQLLGPVVRAKPTPTGKNQIPVMAALRAATAHVPAGISWGEASRLAADALPAATAGRRNSIAKATLNGLLQRGTISIDEGLIKLA